MCSHFPLAFASSTRGFLPFVCSFGIPSEHHLYLQLSPPLRIASHLHPLWLTIPTGSLLILISTDIIPYLGLLQNHFWTDPRIQQTCSLPRRDSLPHLVALLHRCGILCHNKEVLLKHRSTIVSKSAKKGRNQRSPIPVSSVYRPRSYGVLPSKRPRV